MIDAVFEEMLLEPTRRLHRLLIDTVINAGTVPAPWRESIAEG